jgi:hypothetical protein
VRWNTPHKPEIVLVSSDSDAENPNPDDIGNVPAISGNGFEIVDETPTWTVHSLSFAEQRALQPRRFPEWAAESDKYMFNIEGKEALPRDQFRDRIESTGDM